MKRSRVAIEEIEKKLFCAAEKAYGVRAGLDFTPLYTYRVTFRKVEIVARCAATHCVACSHTDFETQHLTSLCPLLALDAFKWRG